MKAQYTISVTLPLRRGTREVLRQSLLKTLATRGESLVTLRSVRVKRA
jgi:hypothetical protein